MTIYGEEGNAFGETATPELCGGLSNVLRSVDAAYPRGVDVNAIEKAVKAPLTAIDEDPDREDLQDVPRHLARFWRKIMSYKGATMKVTVDIPYLVGFETRTATAVVEVNDKGQVSIALSEGDDAGVGRNYCHLPLNKYQAKVLAIALELAVE